MRWPAGILLAALAALAACAAVPAAPGMAAFRAPSDAVAATLPFSGRLTLTRILYTDSRVLRDDFHMLGRAAPPFSLPPFDFRFAGDGDVIVPARRRPIDNAGHRWQYILLPGRSWRAAGEDADRAAIPFALIERNANCLHYGVLRVSYPPAGGLARADWRIASETCQYLKFDAHGAFEASFEPGRGADDAALLARLRDERRARLPRRDIAELREVYPGIDASRFGSAAEIDPAHMTTFGLVIDGVHWVGGCGTRAGPYPYCEELPLPSYSLAKSLAAGLGVMRAEFLYPATRHALIADLVPACRGNPAWHGVTLEHALDMATGHYSSNVADADEDALLASEFFLAEDHAAKIRVACNRWPRREPPGQRFVYHSTDSYIVGTALNALLRAHAGRGADSYRDLVVVPIWEPLTLSPLSRFTRRTLDDEAQAFTGWGLALLADDIARIADFLGPERARIDGTPLLDADLYDAAMQRRPHDRGLPAGADGLRYNNGFWAYDAGPALGCDRPAWVPLMSGYGGIIVTLFPNGTAYYYVSDGGTHRWLEAARAAEHVRPICDQATGGTER